MSKKRKRTIPTELIMKESEEIKKEKKKKKKKLFYHGTNKLLCQS